MKRITSRFALLLAAAGILPLLVYGAVSIYSLRDATRRSVITGNENVARRVAEQIGLYVQTNVDILQSVAGNLEDTNLEQWQQDRILKNAVLDFPEFREITLYDAAGSSACVEPSRPVEACSSRSPAPRSAPNIIVSPIDIDDDLLPSGDRRHQARRRSAKAPARSSARSASKKCGGWSIASRSASRAMRSSSLRTAS